MAESVMNTRVDRVLEKAESRKLLRQVGIEPQGWFSQQRCWLFCQIGHLLVAMGKQLQHYALPQPVQLDG
jgi:hypothetical protein